MKYSRGILTGRLTVVILATFIVACLLSFFSKEVLASEEGLIHVEFESFPYDSDSVNYGSYEKLKGISAYVLRIYPEDAMMGIRKTIKATEKYDLKIGDVIMSRGEEYGLGKVFVENARALLRPKSKNIILDEIFSKGMAMLVIVNAEPLPPFVDIPVPPGNYYIAYSLVFLKAKKAQYENVHPSYPPRGSAEKWGAAKVNINSPGQVVNITFAPTGSIVGHYDQTEHEWENHPVFWEWVKYLMWAGEWN